MAIENQMEAVINLLITKAMADGKIRFKHSRDINVNGRDAAVFAMQTKVGEGTWKTISNVTVTGMKEASDDTDA